MRAPVSARAAKQSKADTLALNRDAFATEPDANISLSLILQDMRAQKHLPCAPENAIKTILPPSRTGEGKNKEQTRTRQGLRQSSGVSGSCAWMCAGASLGLPAWPHSPAREQGGEGGMWGVGWLSFGYRVHTMITPKPETLLISAIRVK